MEKGGSKVAFAIHMQELSSALTPELLEGTNYVEWSLNEHNKIRGRKNWGYIFLEQKVPLKIRNLKNMKHGKMKTAWSNSGF